MCTHLGKPITFLPDSNPEDVKRIVREKASKCEQMISDTFCFQVRALILQHQRLPGSIFVGIWQRFKRKDPNNQRAGGDTESVSADEIEMDGINRERSINDLPCTVDLLSTYRETDAPFSGKWHNYCLLSKIFSCDDCNVWRPETDARYR